MAERRRHLKPTCGQAWLHCCKVPRAMKGGQSAQVFFSLEPCALLQSVQVLLAGRNCVVFVWQWLHRLGGLLGLLVATKLCSTA